MGNFPTVTLNAELITRWRKILEAHGMTVWINEEEERKHPGNPASRVLDVAWYVSDGITDMNIAEVTDRDRNEVYLILLAFGGKNEHRLAKIIQEILIASGASTEKRKK